jgi:hypothetical protein
MKHLLAAAVVTALAAGAYVFITRGLNLGWLQSQASALDTAQVRNEADYGRDTLATDSLVKFRGDSFKVPAPVKAAVTRERQSAGRVIATGKQQVTNLKQQVRALQPRLWLTAELAYATTLREPVQGAIEAELDINVRIRQDLEAFGGLRTPLLGTGQRQLKVGLRQHFRLY